MMLDTYGRRGAGIVCGLRAAVSLYYAVKPGMGVGRFWFLVEGMGWGR